MVVLALSLSTLSLLMLAAHFLRRGELFVTVGLVALAVLSLFRRDRVQLRVTQVVLGMGAIIWGLTIAESVRARLAAGGDPARLAAILGAVVLVDLAAIAALNARSVLARFAAPGKAGGPAG